MATTIKESPLLKTLPSSPSSSSKSTTTTTINPSTPINTSIEPIKDSDKVDQIKESTVTDKSSSNTVMVEEEEETNVGASGTGAVVDMEVFGQLLEIDDDESHEFSKTLAFDYISQAETTFEEIDDALNKRDLDTLSRKGHFLKGSSAALGLQRVQHSCESMQHFGNRRDEHGEGPELSEEEALKKCRVLLVRLRKEQEEAKLWMEGFYKA